MLTLHANSFPKREKLCSKVALSELFDKGEAILIYPVRCVYKITDKDSTQEPLQVMVSVSKRYHKHAVTRNLIKRRIREVYRLNRHELKKVVTLNELGLNIALSYVARDVKDYKTIENAVCKIFTQLANRLAADTD